MDYLYEASPRNYEDFASGRVLYNAPGTTSFPVRLASEIAQRCFRHLEQNGAEESYVLYDPCCGGGYLLTVVGLLHGRKLRRIIGSDISETALQIADKNLSLLREEGLDRRAAQLKELHAQFGKPSHQAALESVERIRELVGGSRVEEAACFRCDITAPGDAMARCQGTQIVISDLPYGDIVSWSGAGDEPVRLFFDHIHRVLDPGRSVVAVIADKGQKLRHERFRRLQHFKVGKRQVGIFEPVYLEGESIG